MSTIFDGYKKLSDKQIINQLAVLETINFSNILKFHKNKIKDTAFGTIKKLLGTYGKEDIDLETMDIEEVEYNIKEFKKDNIEQDKISELYEILEEEKIELKKLSREELDIRLKLSLCDRVKSSIEDSNEIVSLDVVDQAIKRYDISENLTPAQKIDKVYELYNDKVLKYLKENPNIVSQNKALDLSDPNLTIYIIVETISSWDMVKGSKNIDKEIMAQSVWLSVIGNIDKFTPSLEQLPSFQLKSSPENLYLEDTVFINPRNHYKKSIEELENNDYKLQDLEEEIDKLENLILTKKSKILDLKNKQKESEKKLREIEVDLEYVVNIYDELQRKIKNKELIKEHGAVSQQLIENKQNIGILKNEIVRVEVDLRDLGINKEYLLIEEKNLKQYRNQARHEYLVQADKRYNELKKLWESHYTRFELDPQFLKEVVEYKIEERIEIERILEELHNTKDFRILSSNFNKEQIKDTYNIEFELEDQKIICIEYSIDDKTSKVRLLKILESIE